MLDPQALQSLIAASPEELSPLVQQLGMTAPAPDPAKVSAMVPTFGIGLPGGVSPETAAKVGPQLETQGVGDFINPAGAPAPFDFAKALGGIGKYSSTRPQVTRNPSNVSVGGARPANLQSHQINPAALQQMMLAQLLGGR